jgi:hypothetical protein
MMDAVMDGPAMGERRRGGDRGGDDGGGKKGKLHGDNSYSASGYKGGRHG